MTIAVDVFPTVAEAIGARLPANRKIDGMSWFPLLDDANAPGHKTLFWEWHKQHAVRQGKWKVVRNAIITHGMSKQSRAEGDDHVFLADLEADPGETTNLRRQHPEIAEQLLALHDAWHADVFSARDTR